MGKAQPVIAFGPLMRRTPCQGGERSEDDENPQARYDRERRGEVP
ncbi:hypothetical protein [Nocardia brevicatena]|nr:hypothetical protein [Nocardia brevicatena]